MSKLKSQMKFKIQMEMIPQEAITPVGTGVWNPKRRVETI
jgi:hypothetical protein